MSPQISSLTKEDLHSELRNHPTTQELRDELKKYPTKQDFKNELKKYSTKKDLKEALRLYATKQDLQEELHLLEKRIEKMFSDMSGTFFTAIDPFMQEMEISREDRTISVKQTRDLQAITENHEKRIKKLETS